ncbi:MAG: NUDIX domain-containing protein [Acidobacteria bacterium]|nr:NUDIX domain-containing protein [Acidobacteriota bacterium]
MPRVSAGILLYRGSATSLEVLLVHPGGPFWAHKDRGAWSLPKGELDPGEDALEAAKREFAEETGHLVHGPFIALTPVRQAGGKVVVAWASEGDFDPALLESTSVTVEWPRGSGRLATFPEVDRAAWFTIDEARTRILKGQSPFLDELVIYLSRSR